MKTIATIKGMKEWVAFLRTKGLTLGLVPTMGALHQGHVSLIRRAREENDKVILGIFVNPTQFDKKEDLLSYPRDIEKDREIASREGVDIIFAPSVEEIYPKGFSTFVEEEDLTERLCGEHRSGHFRGVTTVVMKLLNIISPDRAYFGQKDLQQSQVIKKMVMDLNMNVEVVVLPTVRDKDGLALSSRNQHLSMAERQTALSIYKALIRARELFASRETDSRKILEEMHDILLGAGILQIDYISIVDPETLEELEEARPDAVVALACWVGNTRLIDNMSLSEATSSKEPAPALSPSVGVYCDTPLQGAKLSK